MHEIHITLKSFESSYIYKNAVFLEKIYLLLNKNLHKKSFPNKTAVQTYSCTDVALPSFAAKRNPCQLNRWSDKGTNTKITSELRLPAASLGQEGTDVSSPALLCTKPLLAKSLHRRTAVGKNNDFFQLLNNDWKTKYTSLNLPKKRKLFTVLRGVHIDKKSREQFHFTLSKKKLYMPLNIKQLFIFLFIIKNAYFYGVEIEISICYTGVADANSCV